MLFQKVLKLVTHCKSINCKYMKITSWIELIVINTCIGLFIALLDVLFLKYAIKSLPETNVLLICLPTVVVSIKLVIKLQEYLATD